MFEMHSQFAAGWLNALNVDIITKVDNYYYYYTKPSRLRVDIKQVSKQFKCLPMDSLQFEMLFTTSLTQKWHLNKFIRFGSFTLYCARFHFSIFFFVVVVVFFHWRLLILCIHFPINLIELRCCAAILLKDFFCIWYNTYVMYH